MNTKDVEVLKQAKGVLFCEAGKGKYGSDEAQVFYDAVKAIGQALVALGEPIDWSDVDS